MTNEVFPHLYEGWLHKLQSIEELQEWVKCPLCWLLYGKRSKQWVKSEPHSHTLTGLFDYAPVTSTLVDDIARDCGLNDRQMLLVPMACFSLFLATLSPSFLSLLPSLPPSLPSLPPSLSPSLPLRYVVRRILRRGVRFCTEKLNATPGVFASLVMTVVESLVCACKGSMWSLDSCYTVWFGMSF